jgi:undecaprenyl-diphosphatase
MSSSAGPHWAVIAAALSVWRRFRDGLHELPRGTWRRWFVTMLIGWVGCAAMSALITKLAQKWDPQWLRAWDERTLRAIERGPVSFQNAILLESPGNLIYMIPLVACVAIAAARFRRPVFAVTIVASYLIARTIVIVGWQLWDRPRPTLIADGIAAPPLHSYPSGHIVLAMSVYLPLAYAWCRASRSNVERAVAMTLAVVWCAAAGYARVRLGTHWPSDVIAGGLLGLAWAAVVIFTLSRTDRPIMTSTDV